MKIISAIGGTGSTFIIDALERTGSYPSAFGAFDAYTVKQKLDKWPALLGPFHFLLKLTGGYTGHIRVLRRPDAFWTDWRFHPSATYEPGSASFQQDLAQQRRYIVKTKNLRSARLTICQSHLTDESLPSLVRSYIDRVEEIERQKEFMAVLLATHWGEYGVFRQLELETIYVVRDPFNALISHSKDTRHGKDYRRRQLEHINTKRWIDNYLLGPHHYWLEHSQAAISHDNATIVRYHRFADDWQQVDGLPNIGAEFTHRANNVRKILTLDSINYIYEQTREVCEALGFEETYKSIIG